MDTVFLTLTLCLSLAFTGAMTENGQMNLLNTSTLTGQDIVANSTETPSLPSTEQSTLSTTLITGTTLTSAAEDTASSTLKPSTATTVNHFTTLKSTTAEVPSTSRSTQSTGITTSVRHTEPSTTVSHQTNTSATVTTSTNSSVINATSKSVQVTQGMGLSQSDKNLTITFSVILGVFVLAVVTYKLHSCSHKLQFLHQPLNNRDDLNVTTADPDSLVISGGLHEGHPIYDNVPPATQDESQFRLEFLH